jgi:thiol-disulfide isomerase/thioredoxin
MQKLFLIFTCILCLSIPDAYSQHRKIQFIEKPWQDIVTMSRQENKVIFLDAYASWCGPCKWMAANMFTNDSIADYYNRTFICASFDMEKGEGIDLRKKYAVRAYPSLVFIDTAGNMIHERVGAPQRVQDYFEMGSVALHPSEGLAAYMKRYEAGENTPQFVQTYLTRMAEAYMPVEPVMKKYFSTQKESELSNRANWNIMYRYVYDINDPLFNFLLKHKSEFIKAYTVDSVNNKISDVFLYSLRGALQKPTAAKADSLYKSMKEKVKATGFEGADKVIFTTDLQYFQMRGKNKEFLELASKDLDKYYANDFNMLSNISWMVSSITSDTIYMKQALAWSKRSVSLREEPNNLSVYATLLFKMGNKSEAVEQEKKAIALAKERNVSATQYEDALKRMEDTK